MYRTARQLSTVTRSVVVRGRLLAAAGLAVVGGVTAGPVLAGTVPGAAAPVPVTQPAQPVSGSVDYTFQEQPNAYFCGPAATRIALSAHGRTPSQQELATVLGTTTAGTDSVLDVTRVLNATLGRDLYRSVEITGDSATDTQVRQLRADLTAAIDAGRVVVVNVIGTATDVDGVARPFPFGHYLTVVGYDAGGDRVRVADPWQPVGDGTYWMSVAELADWAASRGYSA